jgi:hypothetical protein
MTIILKGLRPKSGTKPTLFCGTDLARIRHEAGFAQLTGSIRIGDAQADNDPAHLPSI